MTPRILFVAAVAISIMAPALTAGAGPAPTVAPSAATITPAQLDAVLAPIALYPDALLAQMLMAATYSTEIEEADQWLKESANARLRGDGLVTALEPRPWDPSVKALVPFPETIEMLATRPAWIAQFGRAFAAAPAPVMSAIQRLRRQAIATGKLTSAPRQLVQEQSGAIVITPADPAVIYVPVYNPALVFGAWAYPDYPPMFIEPPVGFRVTGADIETGIGFSVGFGVIRPLWGWAHPVWGSGDIDIDTAAYNRINRYGPHASASVWHHEPHPTGYFHITPSEVSPQLPPARQERAVPASKPPARSHDHAKNSLESHRESHHTKNRAKPVKSAAAHRHDKSRHDKNHHDKHHH